MATIEVKKFKQGVTTEGQRHLSQAKWTNEQNEKAPNPNYHSILYKNGNWQRQARKLRRG